MIAGLGLCGWAVAVVLALAAVRLRRRLELVAFAAHELRGPVTALGFAVTALRREPGGRRRALSFEAELERMRAGLGDLEAAREGRREGGTVTAVGIDGLMRGAAAGWRPAAQSAGRGVRFRWEGEPAAVRADSGRLAQALGNLLANAVEHGSGPVEARGRRDGARVRLEVRDRGGSGGEVGSTRSRTAGRGRGLAIAARAIEEAGGTLTIEHRAEGGTVAAIDLPVADP